MGIISSLRAQLSDAAEDEDELWCPRDTQLALLIIDTCQYFAVNRHFTFSFSALF